MSRLSQDWVPIVPVVGSVLVARSLGRDDSHPDRVLPGTAVAVGGMLAGLLMAAW